MTVVGFEWFNSPQPHHVAWHPAIHIDTIPTGHVHKTTREILVGRRYHATPKLRNGYAEKKKVHVGNCGLQMHIWISKDSQPHARQPAQSAVGSVWKLDLFLFATGTMQTRCYFCVTKYFIVAREKDRMLKPNITPVSPLFFQSIVLYIRRLGSRNNYRAIVQISGGGCITMAKLERTKERLCRCWSQGQNPLLY